MGRNVEGQRRRNQIETFHLRKRGEKESEGKRDRREKDLLLGNGNVGRKSSKKKRRQNTSGNTRQSIRKGRFREESQKMCVFSKDGAEANPRNKDQVQKE